MDSSGEFLFAEKITFKDSMAVSSVAVEKTCSIQGSSAEGMSGRRKQMCKGVKYELVEYDSLPDYMRDNEFVLGYYRCEWPMKQTILSIFSIHNETINVWTHLIGFLIFLALTAFTAMMIPWDMSFSIQHSLPSPLPGNDIVPPLSGWNLPNRLINCLPKRLHHESNHTNPCVLMSLNEDLTNIVSPVLVKPITRWPFFAFLCGAMFCLLNSSICHLVSCHSERMTYTMLRLDYTGISALIVTSFYPLVYYSFMCEPFFCNLYMGFITTFGVATVLASLVPSFQNTEFRTVRSLLFCCMGISGLVPIMHKLVAFNDRPEAILSTGYELLMGTFYGLGVVVYATMVPERWMPGKFDLVGHSHQLFHVLVIAGAYTHYLAGLVYLEWRDKDGC